MGLVLAGIASAGVGLWQAASGTALTLVPGTTIERVRALYGSPDNLGLLFDRALPVWIALAIGARRPLVLRALLWAVGAIMTAVLILTYSRAAWVAIAIATLVMIALYTPWGRYVLVAAFVVAGAGALVEGTRLVHTFRSAQTPTTQRRLDLWRSSLRMVRDHPLFGVGPDNFLHYYAPAHQTYIPCPHGLGYMNPEAHDEPCLSHPHDEILDFWLSTGILGLLAFLWLQFVFWRNAVARWRVHRDVITLGVMGAMVAALVHGLVDNSYFLVDLSLYFWLLCAMVSNPSSPHDAPGSTAPRGYPPSASPPGPAHRPLPQGERGGTVVQGWWRGPL
jgi:O-antigen ligase